jgi:very-short-patch-repair endonuclease
MIKGHKPKNFTNLGRKLNAASRKRLSASQKKRFKNGLPPSMYEKLLQTHRTPSYRRQRSVIAKQIAARIRSTDPEYYNRWSLRALKIQEQLFKDLDYRRSWGLKTKEAFEKRRKNRKTWKAYLKARAAIMEQRWKDPLFRKKALRKWRVPNRFESEIARILKAGDLEFVYEPFMCGYLPDFYLPKFDLVIECDGVYWHKGKEDRDSKRDAAFKKAGHSVLHVSDAELRRSQIDVVSKISSNL